MTIRTAEKEALMLAVNDPRICITFQEYLRDHPTTDVNPTIFYVLRKSEVVDEIHQRWSEFIASGMVGHDEDLVRSYYDALRKTLQCVP